MMKDDSDADCVDLDTHRITAAMLYPMNENQQEDLWAALHREDIIQRIMERDEWPVTMDRPEFMMLKNAPALASLSDDIEKRRQLGWHIGLAFLYQLRVLPNFLLKDLPQGMGEIGSNRKFVHFASKTIEGGKIAGTDIDGKVTAALLNKASSEMWPVAHYWAAEFTAEGKERFPEKTPETWMMFMQLAESFRFMGLALGIFSRFGGKKYDESSLHYHSRITAFEQLVHDSFGEEERKLLLDYQAM